MIKEKLIEKGFPTYLIPKQEDNIIIIKGNKNFRAYLNKQEENLTFNANEDYFRDVILDIEFYAGCLKLDLIKVLWTDIKEYKETVVEETPSDSLKDKLINEGRLISSNKYIKASIVYYDIKSIIKASTKHRFYIRDKKDNHIFYLPSNKRNRIFI
jgi:hypothetical protein